MKIAHPRSLFGQVVLLHIMTITVAAFVLPAMASVLLRNTAARYRHDALEHQAAALEKGLVRTIEGHWRVRIDDALTGLYQIGYDGRAYGIVDDRGSVLAASPRLDRAMLRLPRLPMTHFFRYGSVDGLSLPIVRNHRRIWIIVSQDMSDPEVVTDDIVRTFQANFLLMLLLLLPLVPVIGALLLRRTTRKVRGVSRLAAEIGPANLAVRLPLADLPLEITPLAEATNKALDRLEEGYHIQSEFAANVAHELRTPLALLGLQLDALDESPAKKRIRTTLDHASHVVTQLFDLASLERIAIAPDECFDLLAMARQVVEAMAPAILSGDRTISVGGAQAPIWVHGRAPLMALALSNLIDNAVRHTPVGTDIDVEVEPDGTVRVSDNGPGLAQVEVTTLTRRFWRADHARTDSAGIGLSIVQRIVDAHEGRLRAGQSRAGGACFEICLPTAT